MVETDERIAWACARASAPFAPPLTIENAFSHNLGINVRTIESVYPLAVRDQTIEKHLFGMHVHSPTAYKIFGAESIHSSEMGKCSSSE